MREHLAYLLAAISGLAVLLLSLAAVPGQAKPAVEEPVTPVAFLPVVVCASPTPMPTAIPTEQPSCSPCYPDHCIPPPPPDLDCPEIPWTDFRVVGCDPHRFDGDNDGLGCES